MIKQIQNRVAESRIALPTTAVYALIVWLMAGLIGSNLWIQLCCTTLATYLMVELNNQNALIRIYSRMVSCAFMVLSCAGCFLFPSMKAALGLVCFTAFLLLFVKTYQNRRSSGTTLCAFAMLGLASLIHVHVLFFVPLFWGFMIFKIQTFSLRTLTASFLGILLPYWFIAPYLAWTGDFTPLLEHLDQLGWGTSSYDYSTMSSGELLFYALLLIVIITGTVHYLRTRYKDKIRTRMLFDCFLITAWVAAILVVLQPQHTTLLIPMLIACVSTLIGHFLALTNTRWTNIGFWAITTLTVFITVYNLWTLS